MYTVLTTTFNHTQYINNKKILNLIADVNVSTYIESEACMKDFMKDLLKESALGDPCLKVSSGEHDVFWNHSQIETFVLFTACKHTIHP